MSFPTFPIYTITTHTHTQMAFTISFNKHSILHDKSQQNAFQISSCCPHLVACELEVARVSSSLRPSQPSVCHFNCLVAGNKQQIYTHTASKQFVVRLESRRRKEMNIHNNENILFFRELRNNQNICGNKFVCVCVPHACCCLHWHSMSHWAARKRIILSSFFAMRQFIWSCYSIKGIFKAKCYVTEWVI